MIQLPMLCMEPIDAPDLEKRARAAGKGAVVTFIGVVRHDRLPEGPIDHLFYEAYEPMALRELERIIREVRARWADSDAVIQHRVGRVAVGESSVFIAVSAPERKVAFEACRFAIDQVRSTVPLWKKDVCANGKAQWTISPHETMLVSDRENPAIPAS